LLREVSIEMLHLIEEGLALVFDLDGADVAAGCENVAVLANRVFQLLAEC
jgi:hypothetical protein